MASTTTVGHVSRALDFFDRTDVFWAIGRTTAWPNDGSGNTETVPAFIPPTDNVDAVQLEETVAYKKVQTRYMVVPDNANGTIVYRNGKYRIVSKTQNTTLTAAMANNATTAVVASVVGIGIGQKIKIGTAGYAPTVTAIAGNTLTLTPAAPSAQANGSAVDAGALAAGSRWVYVETTLYYDEVPLEDYRQVGVFSRLTPVTAKASSLILLPADVQDKGILEVIDNRKVVNRQIDQSETLSIVIEF